MFCIGERGIFHVYKMKEPRNCGALKNDYM